MRSYLDRKSQVFELQEVRLTEQAIDINAQCMSSQLAIKTSTQAPKGMGEVFLDTELPRQLSVDGFDQLTDGVMQLFNQWCYFIN
jgi:hypothetical protein